MQKNETEPLSYSIHKNYLKIYSILNVRYETIKILEVNVSDQLLDIGVGEQATKAKINKWEYMKLKSF